jgi:hypothetical protein
MNLVALGRRPSFCLLFMASGVHVRVVMTLTLLTLPTGGMCADTAHSTLHYRVPCSSA